jgi:DNA polymerase-3 subunit beta
MNLTIAKRDLLRAATNACAIAQRKGTMPALAMVLLDAFGERLTVSSTDLYRARTDTIQAQIKTNGSIAVSAHDLNERVKNLADGPVSLSVKDGALVLKSEGTSRRYTMRGMSGDDFPPLPRIDDGASTITLAAGVLGACIAHVQFSIATDETRPHLNSALIDMEPGKIRMVSTDGHRLSKYERTIEGGAHATMLVPLSAITELKKIDDGAFASGEGATITLVHSGPTLFVKTAGTTFSVKLVDATFPPWQQVIPKATDKTIRVARVALAEAIKAVSVAANDRTSGVKLACSKGTLRITSESPEGGDGVDEVPYEMVEGKDGALIGVNSKYPLDVFGALSCDEVILGMGGELEPMVIRPVSSTSGADAVEFLAILMPMRI